MGVVETLNSGDGRFRAEIWRGDDGLLSVELLAWFTDSDPEYNFESSGWVPIGRQRVVKTDTLELARKLAREELARLAGEELT